MTSGGKEAASDGRLPVIRPSRVGNRRRGVTPPYPLSLSASSHHYGPARTRPFPSIVPDLRPPLPGNVRPSTCGGSLPLQSRLRTVRVETHTHRPLLAASPSSSAPFPEFHPNRPVWSEDGRDVGCTT